MRPIPKIPTVNQKAGRVALIVSLATFITIPAEGIRQKAYYDPPGILTVCYGSTTNVQKGKVYSLAECRERLDADMQAAISAVESCAPGLPVEVAAAFSDAVYNLGPTIACNQQKSSAARLLRARALPQACGQLLRWDKARVAGIMVALPGLTKRRRAEYDLCMKGA